MKITSFLRFQIMLLPYLALLYSCSILPYETKKETKIKALLIDGQNDSHDNWKEWSPVLLKQLDESGLFIVDIFTSPSKGESLDNFQPDFSDYDVVISTYNGDNWSSRTRRAFEKYVEKGGGFVAIHSASSAFPQWEDYNKMLGLSNWNEANAQDKPYIYVNEQGEVVRDPTNRDESAADDLHEIVISRFSKDHPIMKGLPDTWLHVRDEVLDHLRGPGENMEILATTQLKTGERYEPQLMAVTYDKGRVFHTTLGHDKAALSCVGFMTTFIRGAEWAATGKVNFPVPDDFPTAETTSMREY